MVERSNSNPEILGSNHGNSLRTQKYKLRLCNKNLNPVIGSILAYKNRFKRTKMKHNEAEGTVGHTANQMQETKMEGEHLKILNLLQLCCLLKIYTLLCMCWNV